jgi:NAD(P)-dependent dehydrogenase (short-subunit alcohol dehydrogenase family)
MSLIGKIALITGGGTGIGRATAELLANDGAAVVVTGRREKPLRETVDAIRSSGGKADLARGDVSSADDVETIIQKCLDTFGGVDIVVNNAGVVRPQQPADITDEAWNLQMDVNLKGPFLVSRAAMPHIARRGGGAIVNIGSSLGHAPNPWTLAYCVSKAGLLHLTRCLAQAGAEHGIRVNTVSPAVTDTPIHHTGTGQTEAEAREWLEKMGPKHPLGRVGRPGEIAAAVRYLVSDEASWVTGTELVIDGGWLNAGNR